MYCGFVFHCDMYWCSLINDAEQFFEKMEQKDADSYSALMVGLFKVCTKWLLRSYFTPFYLDSIDLMIGCLISMIQ